MFFSKSTCKRSSYCWRMKYKCTKIKVDVCRHQTNEEIPLEMPTLLCFLKIYYICNSCSIVWSISFILSIDLSRLPRGTKNEDELCIWLIILMTINPNKNKLSSLFFKTNKNLKLYEMINKYYGLIFFVIFRVFCVILMTYINYWIIYYVLYVFHYS